MSADGPVLTTASATLPSRVEELLRVDPEHLRRFARTRQAANVSYIGSAAMCVLVFYYEWTVGVAVGGRAAWILPALALLLGALTAAGFSFLRLMMGRTARSVSLVASGVQVVLWNRSEFQLQWSDPKLSFDVDRVPPRRGHPQGAILLRVKSPKYVERSELTESGTAALLQEASRHNLMSKEWKVRRDLFAKPWTVVSVRSESLRPQSHWWE